MVLQRLLPAVLLTAAILATPVAADSLQEQRATFLRAENALQRGDLATFRRLGDGIRNYPLYPYLEYEALLKDLDRADNRQVSEFLETYDSTPLAGRLRARWLDRLAKKERWSDYLVFYEPTENIDRRCDHLHALIATGKSDQALPEVAEIWLYGKSRPRACDPVFAAWSKAGYRTVDMNWERIQKAMDAGQWKLARYLGRGLSNADQVWVDRWVTLYRTPGRAKDAAEFSKTHPYREVMLSYATRRLARWDGLKALELWQTIKPRYPFSEAQVRETEQYIVRNLVRTPGDTAYTFILGVDMSDDDLPAQEARIRAALQREDWPRVLRWVEALPAVEREKESWSYWRARALEGTGQTAAAEALYKQVAKERSYYGFLAADRVGGEYHLAHAETPASPNCLQHVAVQEGIARARELFILERWIDARREWREATKDMNRQELQAAAKFAQRHGWYDRAIFTLARTGYWDDLELRFPLEHTGLVETNANRQGIDIAWVFAVMRQESAFMANARSHAGAMGLMQLMPATARSVAKDVLKTPPPRRYELYQPDTNIALGSAYLKQMKGELGDSAVLATAAYNAGPHRVTRWLPAKTMPADIWIELVPFTETRGYLQRVLAYTVIYEKRMGLPPTRLEERLHPVPPSIGLIGAAQSGRRSESAG